MTTYFLDTFTGSGSLASHTPDVGFGGVSWTDMLSSLSVSGGLLTASGASAAYYGNGTTNYGLPQNGVYGFSFTTGPNVTPASNSNYFTVSPTFSAGNITLKVFVGGGANKIVAYVYVGGATYINAGGNAGAPITLAPNTTYIGNITVTSTSISVTFGSYTATLSYSLTAHGVSAGLNQYFIQLQYGPPLTPGFTLDYLYFADAALTIGGFTPWWQNFLLSYETA